MSKETSGPWMKVLYEHQEYPDNYVADSFLDEMKKNVNTRIYSLSSVVYEAGMVSQQLSSIAMFVAAFYYMNMQLVSPSTVLLAGLTLSFLGYLLCLSSNKKTLPQRGKRDDLKSVILVTGIVLGLSPILKTLTETISTDTIYAMTVGMLATNLLLHDYVSEATMSPSPLSLNASVFASVCLASRLPTSSWHAFVTVLLAMQEHHCYMFICLTVLMTIAAIAMATNGVFKTS
eukprot:gene15770-17361_t